MKKIQKNKVIRLHLVICTLSLFAFIATAAVTTLTFAKSSPESSIETSPSIIASIDSANMESDDNIIIPTSSTAESGGIDKTFTKNAMKIAGFIFFAATSSLIAYFFFLRRPQFVSHPPKTHSIFGKKLPTNQKTTLSTASENSDITIELPHDLSK